MTRNGTERDIAMYNIPQQEENPSIEPAAEATVCACRNHVLLDTVLRSNQGTRSTSL